MNGLASVHETGAGSQPYKTNFFNNWQCKGQEGGGFSFDRRLYSKISIECLAMSLVLGVCIFFCCVFWVILYEFF